MLTDGEIAEIIGSSGVSWSVKPVEGGFQGLHRRLESTDGRSWFVKVQPQRESYGGLYDKEAKVYERLLPRLRAYVKKDVKLWPDLHYTRKGLVVLEDLTATEWSIAKSELTKEHVHVILRSLADFHASSILLDRSTPLPETYGDVLEESYFGSGHPDHPGLQTWASFISTSRKIMSKYFPLRSHSGAVSLLRNVPMMVKASTKHKNSICHGDLWKNNIFFKYINNMPSSACFVDFAQIRYCPPSMDVLLFLRHIQTDDTEHYLRFYHSRLMEHVEDFGYGEFADSCVDAEPFALCVACLYVYLTRLPDDTLREISSSEEKFWAFATGNDGPAMKALEEDVTYREAVLRSFKELIEFTENSATNNNNRV